VAKLLLVSGSLRGGSTNSATLRTAAALAPDGIETGIFDGKGRLPRLGMDLEGLRLGGTSVVWTKQVKDAGRRGEGSALQCVTRAERPRMLRCAGPGDGGGGQTYGMPVAWINVSGKAAPRGGADAHDSLRKVLGYTGAVIVEDACLRLPLARDDVGDDGLITPPEARASIAGALTALAATVD
jgi:chromate reductase, NAD(P)H dehydrogenase (quinone)